MCFAVSLLCTVQLDINTAITNKLSQERRHIHLRCLLKAIVFELRVCSEHASRLISRSTPKKDKARACYCKQEIVKPVARLAVRVLRSGLLCSPVGEASLRIGSAAELTLKSLSPLEQMPPPGQGWYDVHNDPFCLCPLCASYLATSRAILPWCRNFKGFLAIV